MKVRFLLVLALAACANAGREIRRWPSSVEFTEPARKNGEYWLMDWQSAMDYCRDQGGHLPTAREYTQWLKQYGVVTLEAHEVKNGVPKGFDAVDCRNPDGTEEILYVNSKGYTFPPESKRKLLFWTSSAPIKHAQFAHVYYEEWGGGGGKPEEHHKEKYRNAVMCVRGK